MASAPGLPVEVDVTTFSSTRTADVCTSCDTYHVVAGVNWPDDSADVCALCLNSTIERALDETPDDLLHLVHIEYLRHATHYPSAARELETAA